MGGPELGPESDLPVILPITDPVATLRKKGRALPPGLE